MKKMEFGANDDNRLNAQWSKIEFYNGEYIAVINCNDYDFLVTRIVDSQHGLNDNIDVREVAQDYYSDGSYVNYANQEKNRLCQKIAELLNTPKMKQQLAAGVRPVDLLRDAGFPAGISHVTMEPRSERVSEIVTSVKPEMFKKLKDSKKNCRGRSMYDMSQELQRLQQELAQLRENENYRSR